MKNLKDYIKPINEGWTGAEADKAYDDILNAMEGWKPEQFLTLIWNYFSADQLKDLYKWMKQDEYIN